MGSGGDGGAAGRLRRLVLLDKSRRLVLTGKGDARTAVTVGGGKAQPALDEQSYMPIDQSAVSDPRLLLTAQQEAEIRAAFHQIDSDCDGQVRAAASFCVCIFSTILQHRPGEMALAWRCLYACMSLYTPYTLPSPSLLAHPLPVSHPSHISTLLTPPHSPHFPHTPSPRQVEGHRILEALSIIGVQHDDEVDGTDASASSIVDGLLHAIGCTRASVLTYELFARAMAVRLLEYEAEEEVREAFGYLFAKCQDGLVTHMQLRGLLTSAGDMPLAEEDVEALLRLADPMAEGLVPMAKLEELECWYRPGAIIVGHADGRMSV